MGLSEHYDAILNRNSSCDNRYPLSADATHTKDKKIKITINTYLLCKTTSQEDFFHSFFSFKLLMFFLLFLFSLFVIKMSTGGIYLPLSKQHLLLLHSQNNNH